MDVVLTETVWTSSSFTHTGKRRKRNEDALGVYPDQCLWLVADGMGGHDAGDQASSLVVRKMAQYRKQRHRGTSIGTIDRLLEASNAELVQKARRESLGICGSTVAILSFFGDSVVCIWSGDSRIYRFRDSKLTQLTRDHTVENSLADGNESQPPDYDKNSGQQLTAAIGGYTELTVEHCWYVLRPGDTFLLCTDGLTKETSDGQLLQLLKSAKPDGVVDRIENFYLRSRARDNIGVIYVYPSE